MRTRYPRKARRRSRSIRLSGFEPLEGRALLAGDAANTFAVFDGSLPSPVRRDRLRSSSAPKTLRCRPAAPAGEATVRQDEIWSEMAG